MIIFSVPFCHFLDRQYLYEVGTINSAFNAYTGVSKSRFTVNETQFHLSK